MNKGAIHLYNKLKNKHYTPKNICEVGVYLPEESNVIGFIKENVATTLVEADPSYVAKIKKHFSDFKNVKIIEAAVFDFQGKIELCRMESSTFISELEASPALVNDNYKITDDNKFVAKSILFSDIDKGDFDLVSIDIEGAEWYVIKHMTSRPNVISIETHGKYYTNPKIDLIINWMAENNYISWYKDASDTIYVKNGAFQITPTEKMQLLFKNLKISVIKKKKFFKTLFKSK